MAKLSKKQLRARRHQRVRKKIIGSPAIPRMSVYCSEKHIYIQFVDDMNGHTLATASTREADIGGDKGFKANVDMAAQVAAVAVDRAKKANVAKVVFDRGGYKFHGRIKTIAETARQAGLEM